MRRCNELTNKQPSLTLLPSGNYSAEGGLKNNVRGG